MIFDADDKVSTLHEHECDTKTMWQKRRHRFHRWYSCETCEIDRHIIHVTKLRRIFMIHFELSESLTRESAMKEYRLDTYMENQCFWNAHKRQVGSWSSTGHSRQHVASLAGKKSTWFWDSHQIRRTRQYLRQPRFHVYEHEFDVVPIREKCVPNHTSTIFRIWKILIDNGYPVSQKNPEHPLSKTFSWLVIKNFLKQQKELPQLWNDTRSSLSDVTRQNLVYFWLFKTFIEKCSERVIIANIQETQNETGLRSGCPTRKTMWQLCSRTVAMWNNLRANRWPTQSTENMVNIASCLAKFAECDGHILSFLVDK